MKHTLLIAFLAAASSSAAPLETVMVNTNGVQVAPSMLTLTNVVIQGFAFEDLDDVDISGRSIGDVPTWDGTNLVFAAPGGHDPVTLGADDIGSLVGQERTVSTNDVIRALTGATVPAALISNEEGVGLQASGTFSQIALTAGASSYVEANPKMVAPLFEGSGAGLYDIAATNLIGTIDGARLPAILPALDGSALTGVIPADASVTAAKTTIGGTPDGTKFLRDDWTWQAAAGGGIGGSTGGTDNLALRANGAGGATVQSSALQIDDATASTQQNVALVNADPATNSALVLTPKGTGALIFGPKPNAEASGGNARGTYAVDLQMTRNSASQVASGGSAVVIGAYNTASGVNAIAIGTSSQAIGAPGGAGQASLALGHGNVSSSWASYTFGEGNTSSAARSMAFGSGATADDLYSVVLGCWNTVSSDRQYQFKVRADNGITHQNGTGTMTFWGKLTTAPVSGVNAGDIYYNTTDNKHYGYNGSTWNAFY